MEINNIQPSQIMPVSVSTSVIEIEPIIKQFENFFFTKNQTHFKAYKEAFTKSLAITTSPENLIRSLFLIMEDTIKLESKESNKTMTPEQLIILKESFNILNSTVKTIFANTPSSDIGLHLAALIGLVLAKLKK